MTALAAAPSVEPSRARHAAGAVTPPWRLLLRFATHFKFEYLQRFPSNFAWMVLRRKYDAFTTDRAYDTRPSSWLGPLGWWADRRVLHYPLHVALRERLHFVSTTLVEEVERRLDGGSTRVRVLSAPCGLCRDVLQAATALQRARPGAAARLEVHALDLDARGDVIPEARRRSRAAGVPLTFHREDLLDPTGLAARCATGPRFDVVSCIGLTAWLSLPEVDQLVRLFHDVVLTPGGTLLVDNWAWHEHSALGEDLEIHTVYHPPADFRRTLKQAGFRIVAERQTTNGVTTLMIAEAV